jgi:hypothetical protein
MKNISLDAKINNFVKAITEELKNNVLFNNKLGNLGEVAYLELGPDRGLFYLAFHYGVAGKLVESAILKDADIDSILPDIYLSFFNSMLKDLFLEDLNIISAKCGLGRIRDMEVVYEAYDFSSRPSLINCQLQFDVYTAR